MNFPTTILSIPGWEVTGAEQEWSVWFETYHGPMRTFAMAAFKRRGWLAVDPIRVDEVVMRVFETIYTSKEDALDLTKGGVRRALRMLINRRVVDCIRANAKDSALVPIESAESIPEPDQDEQEELYAYLGRAILQALRSRCKLSKMAYLVFEMVKLQGREVRDVARETDLTPNDVYRHINRVMEKLKALCTQSNLAQMLQRDCGEMETHDGPAPTLASLLEDEGLVTYLHQTYATSRKFEVSDETHRNLTRTLHRTFLNP